MTENRDIRNLRRTNDRVAIIGLLVGIGTLLGMAWALCSYPMRWTKTIERLDILEPLVRQNRKDIDQVVSDMRDLKTIEQGHQDEIIRRLVRIENKFDRQTP